MRYLSLRCFGHSPTAADPATCTASSGAQPASINTHRRSLARSSPASGSHTCPPRPGVRSAQPAPVAAQTAVAEILPAPDPETTAFDDCLRAWEASAPLAEKSQRATAAAALRKARVQCATTLELTGLTELPDCLQRLPKLESLTLTQCSMSTLPNLPPGLRSFKAEDLGLRSLPSLPEQLNKLVLRGGLLRTLPPLPESLVHLDVRKQRLTSLLDADRALPAGLVHLDVSDNALTMLPALPENLDELFVQNNHVTALPELPPRLGWLVVSHNRLTNVPALPASLRMLYLDHNALEDLPDSITQTTASYTINIEHNPFPPEVLERVATRLRLRSGYQLRMRFNLPSDDPERRRPFVFLATGAEPMETALTREALFWYSRDGVDVDGFRQAREKWRACEAAGDGLASIDPSGSFRTFLHRLAETAEYREPLTRAAFTRRVTTMLDAAAADPELCSQTVAIATEGLGTCADRIATSLDQIDMARITMAARRGAIDRPALVATGKDLFKLTLLDRIASAYYTAHRRDDLDEVEVQLAFRTRLADRLGLTTQTRATLYADAVKLRGNALDQASDTVQGALADQAQVAQFLSDWAPWQAHLEKTEASALAPAQAAMNEAKTHLYAKLDTALAQLTAAREQSGELSAATLDRQAKVAALQREFDGLERQMLQPARQSATRRILDAMPNRI